jgi:hypothetical protein
VATVIVCGYMVRHPVAGNLLAYFHYVLGLHRLGHRVVYVEESGWPASCYDPRTATYSDDATHGLAVVRALFAAHDLPVPVYYAGPPAADGGRDLPAGLEPALAAADLLLDVGGVCWLPAFGACPRRALVDMDPLFTQLGRFGGVRLAAYTSHFTYGASIGRPDCLIPEAGVAWRPTAPPVVLDLWPRADPAPAAPFTTVSNWDAYGGIDYGGQRYGQKDEEWLRVRDLPRAAPARLEVALTGAPPAARAALEAGGWSIRDAAPVSATLSGYGDYIRGSRGEFSVAKGAYVRTRSGWFSDRSVCYLAAGLPVVVQDTGWRALVPGERGVLTFSSAPEAAAALARVADAYPAHRRAAREIAAAFFDYRVTLPPLLDHALAAPAAAGPPAEARA